MTDQQQRAIEAAYEAYHNQFKHHQEGNEDDRDQYQIGLCAMAAAIDAYESASIDRDYISSITAQTRWVEEAAREFHKFHLGTPWDDLDGEESKRRINCAGFAIVRFLIAARDDGCVMRPLPTPPSEEE